MAHYRSTRGAAWSGQGEEIFATKTDQRRDNSLHGDGEDYLTARGAVSLAARIISFWREHAKPGSKPVLCHMEQTREFGGLCCVRSNLVGGLPRR